ncbi:MAG: nucleotide-binding protein [Bacteroidota bacterium]
MLYHIKLMHHIDRGECKINITEEELIERYVEPYLTGDTIVINGTTIDPMNLWRVKITESEFSLDSAVNKIKSEDSIDRSMYKHLRPKAEWRAIDVAKDVTDKYINKAPGSQKKAIRVEKEIKETSLSNEKVFVVHGHDTELKNDVELFLRSINLEPIVLHRQLDEGLTIIEKFEKHSDVKYAMILLTPDDIGYAIEENEKNEMDRLLELRARQNVIFEFGFFVGKLSRKNVCCIYKEGVTLPSDLNGLIYKQVDKSIEEIGLFLMKELKNCGLKVKYE